MALSSEPITYAWLAGKTQEQWQGYLNGFGGREDPDPEGMRGEELVVYSVDESMLLAAAIADGYVPREDELETAFAVGYKPTESL